MNKIVRFTKKAIRDLLSTLYDDYDFQYMSAPRVWGWIACTVIVGAWLGDQFFDKKFSGWTQLVTWATACLGAYAAKKYVDKDKSTGTSTTSTKTFNKEGNLNG